MTKTPLAIIGLAFCMGCAHRPTPFVQGNIRIVPPVTEKGYNPHEKTVEVTLFNDGGTRWIKITDAEGKEFDVYVDHRIDTKTPGAIYLIDYPGHSNSVQVFNRNEFKKKLGKIEALE